MGIAKRIRGASRAFSVGLIVGAICVFFTFFAGAAVSTINPDGDGNTNGGSPNTCGGLGNFDCLNDGIGTSSSPGAGDFLRQTSGIIDFFTMSSISSIATATEVRIPVYHLEGGTNMSLDVSLWDINETTQYGTTQVLTTRSSLAQWDTAYFTGLSLTQGQLDGLRVRLQCTKGAGKGSQCDSYAMFGSVVYSQNPDVVVSSFGTQKNLRIGTTTAYVGGVFSISENTGSRNLTSITITESGNVNAQTGLDNIKLQYSTTTGSCSGAVYSPSLPQFGSTDTDGFSAANGTSAFTGSVPISTAYDMCVFVVLDVTTSATPRQTMELSIANPTTDIGASGVPVISPGTSVDLPGTTIIQNYVRNQIHYHWRDDVGNETGSGSLTSGSQDTTFTTAGVSTIYRLRMEVSNDGNINAPTTAFGLEYGVRVTTCGVLTEGDWVAVGATGGDWDMAGTGSGLSEGADTTNIGLGIGGVSDATTTFVGTGGQRESTGTTSAVTLTPSQFYEMEFAIIADAGATQGTTYCFRVTDNGAPISTYTQYPKAAIAADVSLTATSTPPATVIIPDTDVYGGGFVVNAVTAGSRTVNSFTLTASGTVDLQNDIDNITLRYEADTVAPYDCTGETYGGTETIYGSVDTDGFSGSNNTVFTDGSPPSVSPTQGLCFYVEYDVSASSTDGEKIEFRVADASTDVVLSSGSVSPAALVDIGGVTTFVKPSVTLQHFHWRNNLGTETTAGSLTGGEDLTYSGLTKLSTIRLRMGISNTGSTSTAPYQYRLEWAQRISTCAAATGWIRVDTASDAWAVVASQLVDNADTTDVSTANGGVTNVGTFQTPNGGQQETNDITNATTLGANQYLELEYSVQATAAALSGSTYCFRVTNNGAPLDAYTNYPKVSVKFPTDFKIQRGTTTIPNGTTTAKIIAGNQYDAPSTTNSAFIRIINNGMTGRGPAAGVSGSAIASDVTTYILDPSNIQSSVSFRRAGTANDTLIMWEIIEYTGAAGGENEMIVRAAGVTTYGTTNLTANTPTISGISDDNDVVPFITAQGNPDTTRFDYNTGLSVSSWNAGSDTATFTRGEHGNDAVNTSYAIVEFTGSNWKIQRAQMNYNASYTAGTATTSPITSVNSLSKAFVYAQHNAGSNQDQHGDFGHEVWLSSVGAVSFRLNGAVQTPTLHQSVAWVIENTQPNGDVMEVTPSSGTLNAGAGGLTSFTRGIGKTVSDLSVTGILFTSSNGGTGRTFPEPILSVQLLSTSNYNIQITDNADANVYQTQVVEWPTAAPKFAQSNFRLYEDNNQLTPTSSWSGLGENEPMTNLDNPIGLGQSIRIRMNLAVSGAAMPASIYTFNLEYAENPGSCSAASGWHLLGTQSSTTALWRGNAGTPADGATISTTVLSASTVGGTYEEDPPTALNPNSATVGDFVEFDWNIEHNGAPDKTDYCFRMVDNDRSVLDNGYNTYPIIRTAGYGPVIGGWRWYDDAESLTPTSDLALENIAPSGIDYDNAIKLRVVLAETQGATGVGTKFALQYSEYSDFSQGVYSVVSSSTCAKTSTTTAQLWCYEDGAGNDNDLITMALISDADSCVAGIGSGCGTRNEGTSTASSFNHTAYTNAEFEFTLRQDGARAGVVYYFRLYDLVHDEAVVASSTYPSLSTQSAGLTFSVTGLPLGTATEGVTTDVATTPDTIAFGSVPLDTEYEAAHRLTINTNATEGYQVLVYATQDLLNSYGTAINAVTASNATPSGWNTGCSVSALGCFGYHTGDAVLDGGSTRFFADDSYAAFETAAREVMYSSLPADDTTDVIYKVEVRPEQPAGVYESEVVYIAIPTF